LLSSEQDLDPTFDMYSRVNSLKWGTNAIIYENVFDAITDGTIYEYGGSWTNDTTYVNSTYNNANILELNSTTTDPLVASTAILVPPGYSMIWVRALNEGNRHIRLDLYFDESNEIGSPTAATYVDETAHFGQNDFPERFHPYNSAGGPNRDSLQHVWLPMSLPNANGGTAYLVARKHTTNNPDYWISGLALTGNPWGFSRTNAIAARNAVRIGSVGGTSSQIPDWFGGYEGTYLVQRSTSASAASVVLRHTVVDNGQDKVLHVVGCGDTSGQFRPVPPLFANGTQLEPIGFSLDPFSWHVSENNHQLAISSFKIPAAIVSQFPRYMGLTFLSSASKNNNFYFSDIITCDLRA